MIQGNSAILHLLFSVFSTILWVQGTTYTKFVSPTEKWVYYKKWDSQVQKKKKKKEVFRQTDMVPGKALTENCWNFSYFSTKTYQLQCKKTSSDMYAQ